MKDNVDYFHTTLEEEFFLHMGRGKGGGVKKLIWHVLVLASVSNEGCKVDDALALGGC